MILEDYEKLCKKISEEKDIKISEKEKEKFIIKVKEIKDKEKHELLYVIIKKYYIDDLENKNDKVLTQLIPYSGKKLKKNIKFDFDKLPKKLQKLLILFLEIEE